ncbi:hypothetical protein R70211_01355 [Paraburkholderia domus]|uniref:Uncharacterized protein n=1 Tax=Paraburkholderia domus TaxID=2793075 RepID=A0A9N8MLA1_9BURK|nr:hypothetical protein R70211_01355 [Paraburkholderia domus]
MSIEDKLSRPFYPYDDVCRKERSRRMDPQRFQSNKCIATVSHPLNSESHDSIVGIEVRFTSKDFSLFREHRGKFSGMRCKDELSPILKH